MSAPDPARPQAQVTTAPQPAVRVGVDASRSPGRGARRRDAVLAAVAGATSLAIYVRSLLPGVGYSGDTAKWQFLGEVGGTPHASGYPLYLALNRAFVRAVPVGSLAWRANLLSAVLGALAIALLFALLRTLGVRRSVALATSLTFAVTVTFWSQSVVAEVYSLQILLLVAIVTSLVRWRRGDGSGWLAAAAVLWGLALGNHLGTVLLVPGFASTCWSGRGLLRRWHFAALAAAVVLGVAQYAYLVHLTRTGLYVETAVRDVGDIATMLTGGEFRDRMFAFSPREVVVDRLPMLGRFLAGEVGPLVAVSAIGAVAALRWRWGPAVRDAVVVVGSLGLLATIHALGYDVADVFVFYLPLYLMLAVTGGLGGEVLAARWSAVRWSARPAARRTAGARWGLALGAAALVVVPVTTGLVNYRRASQRGNLESHERIERLIDAAGTGAVLITDNYDDSEYIWYFLLGEGIGARRDLHLVDQLAVDEVVDRFTRGTGRLAEQAPVDHPVFTATEHQADGLRDAGLRLVEVDDEVWRVEGPRTAGPRTSGPRTAGPRTSGPRARVPA